MSADESVQLNLENVLWRTRGRQWDYSFVLRSLRPLVDSWYDVHLKAFAGVTLDETPTSLAGILVQGFEEYPFVASAFLDARRRDSAGRPVGNYFIWFPNVGVQETLRQCSLEYPLPICRAR